MLNFLAFIVHSCQYLGDKKFQSWLKKYSCTNPVVFWVAHVVSLLLNYKFRQIIFTKIFNFDAFRAELVAV